MLFAKYDLGSYKNDINLSNMNLTVNLYDKITNPRSVLP